MLPPRMCISNNVELGTKVGCEGGTPGWDVGILSSILTAVSSAHPLDCFSKGPNLEALQSPTEPSAKQSAHAGIRKPRRWGSKSISASALGD